METAYNITGVHAVSYGKEFCIAVPSPQKDGHVQVAWFRLGD